MTHVLQPAARPALLRQGAIAAALAVALGLGAPAVWLASQSAAGSEGKLSARLDAGPTPSRELVFTPRDRVADDSIRNFRPGKAWTVEAPAFEPAVAALIDAKPAVPAKPRLAAAPRPPVRPAALDGLAHAAPAPGYAALPADRRTASASALRMPAFGPAGADVMKRIGGLGATMRDSIGSVGASLGKLMRISSR